MIFIIFKMKIVISFKVRTSFKEYMNYVLEDVCQFLGSVSSNVFFKIMLGWLQTELKILHPCPYEVIYYFDETSKLKP